MKHKWDDEALLWPRDSGLAEPHRRHQSWYRETVLNASYGLDPKGRPLGSRLDPEAVRSGHGSNFLDDESREYAHRRAAVVKKQGGALDAKRLNYNMLSSMPLCFNIFGSLRRKLALADLCRTAFDVDAAIVEMCECEWTPRANGLGDRTAFDAFIGYVTPSGSRRFLGIETKYTEPFSTRVYGDVEPAASRYRKITKACGWFQPGASKALATKQTDQLWRNTMLAASVEADGAQWWHGEVVVLHLEADQRAIRAVAAAREQLADQSRLRSVTLERLVEAAMALPDLTEWAKAFELRYLGPSPALLTPAAA